MVSPAKVADRATVNGNAAVTTVDLVLSNLTVGHFLIIRAAADNSGGSGAARTVTVTNQSGTPIDTATDQAYQHNTDPGAASAGTTVNVFVAKITGTSGTVRLTYSGSVVQAAVAEQWSGIDPTTPVVGTPVGASGTASTNLASTTDTSVAVGNCAYAAVSIEGPASDTYTNDADTTNGSWSTLTEAGTSNGTADTNQTIAGAYKVVTGTGGQTHNPTNSAARDSAGLILELAQLTTVSLTVADAGHGHSAGAPALTQHNTLTGLADSAHSHTGEAVTLTAQDPSTGLTVADTAHSHTADAVALIQHHVLAPADSAHGHSAETPSLTQHHVLTVSDAAHPHAVEGTALTQHHTLTPADCAHGTTADTPTLSSGGAQFSLTVADPTHSHTAEPLTLTDHSVIAAAECILQHAAEQVALEQHQALTVDDADLSHTAESATNPSAHIITAGHFTLPQRRGQPPRSIHIRPRD